MKNIEKDSNDLEMFEHGTLLIGIMSLLMCFILVIWTFEDAFNEARALISLVLLLPFIAVFSYCLNKKVELSKYDNKK